MAFRTGKRVFINRLSGLKNSFFCPSTKPVRRNAPMVCPEYSSFSSLPSNTPSFQLLDNFNVQEDYVEDSVQLLRRYGLNDTDISDMEKRCPSIFRPGPRKSLPAQIQFLDTIGLSRSDLVTLMKRNPFLLAANFEKQVIPCYNYFKNLAIDDENLMKMIKDSPGVLLVKFETIIAPNIELLRDMGIPVSSITSFAIRMHKVICRNHERFKTAVEQALAMGLDPKMKTFLRAVRVLSQISKQTWDQKVKIFKSFDFSDDAIALAFRNQPHVMAMSEKKIEKALNLFLKEFSLATEVIARDPVILLMDIERRVVPRFRVMEILREKGLLKRTQSLISFFKYSEEKFMFKFIERHKYDLPELMDIYCKGSSSPR